MHHIYHTRGVILGSVPIGESNRFYKIFTEELGLVHTTAQAVREAKSKLRYSLQDFSQVSLDLVRGREVWRITSAIGAEQWEQRERGNARGEQKGQNTEQRILFARVCALVSRLVHGEGRNDTLFRELSSLARFLAERSLRQELLAPCEALATLRVLVHLGYFDPAGYKEFMECGVWSRDMLETFEQVRLSAIRDINRAIKETHL